MAIRSRGPYALLLLAAVAVAILDTSCTWVRYVYELESFTPKSAALEDASPSVRFVEPNLNSIIGELNRFASDPKSIEVEAAEIVVHCYPAIQSAETQDPITCAMLVSNNTQQDINIEEQSIVLANDLLIGGARKRNPRLVQCEIARVPLRPIKAGEALPILMEFEKDNTKRKSRLQVTIRTGDGKELTYEFTFKGKNK